jgi:hypothetical protein
MDRASAFLLDRASAFFAEQGVCLFVVILEEDLLLLLLLLLLLPLPLPLLLLLLFLLSFPPGNLLLRAGTERHSRKLSSCR